MEETKAFEMFYNSDHMSESLVHILNDIADNFNINVEKIFDLYNEENWIIKSEKRDLTISMEHERKNIKNMAEIKKKYTDFINNEFDKIMDKHLCEKESYFKTPDQLFKFMKLVLEINNVDLNDVVIGLYKLDGDFSYPYEITKKKIYDNDKS